jgi:MFS family permease
MGDVVNGPRGGAFERLTATHAVAVAGDTLITLALAGSLFFSISPTAARGRVALSLLLTMAPFAVVAPLLGPAIDRSRKGRRAMVVLSCLGRAAACVFMAGVLHGLLLFPAAFAVLVLSKAYSVAKSALVPSAVRGHADLVEANSKLAITGVVAGFLAAGPGVLTLQLLGAAWVLRLAALVFVVAGAFALRLNPSSIAELSATSGRQLSNGRTKAMAAAVVMALLRAEVGFLTFLVAFGFRRARAPSWWFGVVLAASMAGTLAGSALAPRARKRFEEETILAGCLGVVAVTSFALATADGRLWAAAMAAVVGLAAGAGKLAFDALVQRDAPEEVRGQQFARYEAGFQLVWVIGALLPVVVVTPLRQGYVVIGIASVIAGVAFVVVRRRLAR